MDDDNRTGKAVVPFDMGRRAGGRRAADGAPSGATETDPARRRHIDRLYREHWRPLCARLRRVFGNGPPDPEDLAQTAFQKLIEQDGLATIRNPGGFLFTVAINKGRDGQRHIARTERLLRDEGILLRQDELDQITPLNVFETRQALSATAAAIGRLTPKQREILTRSRLRGETFDTIRAATGWSKADISRQLAAAMKALNDAARRQSGQTPDQSPGQSSDQNSDQSQDTATTTTTTKTATTMTATTMTGTAEDKDRSEPPSHD